MISRLAKVQLVLFVLVSVLAIAYGATTLLNVGAVLKPPYLVEAQFASPGGIYPRADVDLLGTRVGTVKEIKPGPGSGTTVVLAIDSDVKIPADLTATIGSKSAIGESYVALTPRSDDGPDLSEGDTIPLKRTVSPPDFAELIAGLSSLAGSVPTKDVATVLDELSVAFDGVAPSLGRLLDSSHTVTEASLANVEALTSLIDSAATVLDTQVEVGPQTTTYLAQLAGLTDRLRELDATFDQIFVNGITAGSEVTDLLSANQDALPVLLNNLVTLTDVAADRIPGLRKTLVTFPYVLERREDRKAGREDLSLRRERRADLGRLPRGAAARGAWQAAVPDLHEGLRGHCSLPARRHSAEWLRPQAAAGQRPEPQGSLCGVADGPVQPERPRFAERPSAPGGLGRPPGSGPVQPTQRLPRHARRSDVPAERCDR
jgi:virulence factor Mce-like protein